MITTSPIYRKAARAFLKTSGYSEAREGCIFFWKGDVVGCGSVGLPRSWRPGVGRVDVRTGLVEVATGGDVVNGASSWEELP